MAPKKKVERPQENVSLGPQVREGELVFGVARIFASFNDTFVHVYVFRKQWHLSIANGSTAPICPEEKPSAVLPVV
jgi:hypothetical protein